MLLYAGIDEAGYGPLLGPLCVAATAFELPDRDPGDGAPDLWAMLDRVVTRAGRDKRQRIAVDDSKRLKGPASGRMHPLAHLERGVLSFLASLDRPAPDGPDLDRRTLDGPRRCSPACDGELFGRLGDAIPKRPWYRDAVRLPLAHEVDPLRIDAGRLGRCLASAGVGLQWMQCRMIDPEHLNQEAARLGSKAAVNLAVALSMAGAIWDRFADRDPRIIVDRQSGRTRYAGPLAAAFPRATVEIVAESPELSRYRLTADGSTMVISFLREAEQRHLPVALASMTAKYVRELCMERLNRYFADLVPGLRPTAGYVQDGRRFLADIDAIVRRERLDTPRLVRAV